MTVKSEIESADPQILRRLMDRFIRLTRLWDEFAADNGKELFSSRFFSEIQRLNRFQMDFPGKSPAFPLRALELKTINAFQCEFPESEIQKAMPRFRRFNQNPLFP